MSAYNLSLPAKDPAAAPVTRATRATHCHPSRNINDYLEGVREGADSAKNESALKRNLEAAGYEIHRSGYGSWYITSASGLTVRVSDHAQPAVSFTRPLVCDEPDYEVIVRTTTVTFGDYDLLEGISDALEWFSEHAAELEAYAAKLNKA